MTADKVLKKQLELPLVTSGDRVVESDRKSQTEENKAGLYVSGGSIDKHLISINQTPQSRGNPI